MKERAVIFDMFGVLCCPTSPELEIIRNYGLDSGVHDRLQKAVCGYKFNGDWENYIDGIIGATLVEDTSQNRDIIRGFCYSEFERGLHSVPAEAKDVLGGLKENGYKLGLISNAYPPSRGILEDNNLTEYFEQQAMLLSYEIGMTKQNTGIFNLCLEGLGVPADSAVMVGDSLNSDILSSRAATGGKMGGILISANPSEAAISSKCIIVPSLSDVPEAVKNHFKQRN